MSDRTGWHTNRQLLGLPRPDLPPEQLQHLTARIRPQWRLRARCVEVGTELFFPENGESIPPALRALCAGCPVRRSCLATALVMNERGVWAGVSDTPRQHAARRLRAGVNVESVLDQMLAAAAPRPHHRSHECNDKRRHRIMPTGAEEAA